MTKDRMIVDTLMVLILPVLMAYSLVGEFAHEVLGIIIFFLDYIAVMIFAAQLAFRIQRLLTRNKTGSKA